VSVHSAKFGWQVIWCRDCGEIGVVRASVLIDNVIVWANEHYTRKRHRQIASLPLTHLREIAERATEMATLKEAEEVH
jgi:hypothetical protein